MDAFTVLFDACVLYPAPLRDFLLRLSLTGTFRARWTDDIHDEWTRNVKANIPGINPDAIDRTRRLMDQSADGCLISGYHDLIPSLLLPDPDDRHVLAAAIAGRADVILTFNLKHFPEAALAKYNILPQHPDDFVVHLLDLAPASVYAAIREQRRSLSRPPQTIDQLLDTLEASRLTQAVSQLRPIAHLLL